MKLIVLKSIRDRKYRKALLKSKTLEERIEILEELLEVISVKLRDTEVVLEEQRKLFRKTLRILAKYKSKLDSEST